MVKKITTITIKGEIKEIDKDISYTWNMVRGDGTSIIKKPIYFVDGLMTNRRKERVELYESNIDPLLRFIHIKNIVTCGWINCTNYTINNKKLTKCDIEIVLNWKDINGIVSNENIPIKTLSFDIECGSSHGDFPEAIKGYTKLSKQLLEIPQNKISIDFISNILLNLHRQSICNIDRVFTKKKKKNYAIYPI